MILKSRYLSADSTSQFPPTIQGYHRKNEKQPPQLSSRRWSGGYLRSLISWIPEFIACLLTVGTLVALFVTLGQQNGKPDAQVLGPTSFNITVNSVVAIFSIILKAVGVYVLAQGMSQLKWIWFNSSRRLRDLESFDQASRGPWGALVFLWSLRVRYDLSLWV